MGEFFILGAFNRETSLYFMFSSQHLQTNKGGMKMEYFVIGAADWAQNNKKHVNDVPAGSSKFFWADLLQLGGFAYFETTPTNMTLKFIDGDRKELYQHVMFPRL